MIFQQFFDPTSSTYTYLMARRAGGEALLIDPVYEQVDTYLEHLKRLKLRLVKAIDTHIHADHITGLGLLRDLTKCVTVMGERSGADVVSIRVREDEVVGVDGVPLRVIYTPGHTDDSYSFVMEDRVFTGDTLLIGGSGRTDFQNGDPYAAYDSIFNKLLKLADETLVYPAHDYRGNTVSTIGFERANNPRLQVGSAEAYAELMRGLKLPNPKMMDVAVPANRSIGQSVGKLVGSAERLDVAEVMRLRASGQEVVLVDLREGFERARDGAIPGSLGAPYEGFEAALAADGIVREAAAASPGRVVLYCAFGERSALALDMGRQAGLVGVRHLDGGFAAWIRAGGEIERG